MNIIDYIPKGNKNRISRQMLCVLTNLSDRKVRQLIHNAREKGCLICTDTSEGGYWQPETREETEGLIRMTKSYIANLQRTISKAQNKLKTYEGQVTI
jgi:hypothetical protein